LDDARALAVIVSSCRAAHSCAREINQRSRDIADFARRLKVRRIFERIANCARRSPAHLQRVLNHGVHSAIDEEVIDTETIELLIDNLLAPFASVPRNEASLTALRATVPKSMRSNINGADCAELRSFFAESASFVKQEYEALHAFEQRNVESALTSLRNCKEAKLDAAKVSETMAKALDDGDEDAMGAALHDLITDYVAAVARVWLQNGLKPARGAHPSKEHYRAKFHRFVDLLLTAVVEPWSKRHDGNFEKMAAELRQLHAELPKDIQKIASPAPRRSDVQWLVTDDHVKKALARFKKSTSKHHKRSPLAKR
jgi:hypothetical protein